MNKMKNKKQLYILTGIAIVIIIIAVLLNIDFSSRKSTTKLPEQLFKVDSANVTKIDFEQRGTKFTLSKVDFQWKITSPVVYQANQNFVAQALSSLQRYKIRSLVSTNPQNKDKFGFNDTNFVKITVYENDKVDGSMMIGNMGTGGSITYIKLPDKDEIYLSDGLIRGYFYKERMMNEWRDLSILSIPTSLIKTLEFNLPSEHYTLYQDSTGKFYNLNRDSINTTNLESVLTLLKNMNTQDFKDSTISPDTKAEYSLKVETAEKNYLIEFIPYITGERPMYLLRVSDIKQIFLVDNLYLQNLMKSKKDLVVSKTK